MPAAQHTMHSHARMQPDIDSTEIGMGTNQANPGVFLSCRVEAVTVCIHAHISCVFLFFASQIWRALRESGWPRNGAAAR